MDATYTHSCVPRWSLLCNYCNYGTHSPYISLSFRAWLSPYSFYCTPKLKVEVQQLHFLCCFWTTSFQMWADSVSPDCLWLHTPHANVGTVVPSDNKPLLLRHIHFQYIIHSLPFCVVQAYNLIWDPANVIIDTKNPSICSDVGHRSHPPPPPRPSIRRHPYSYNKC